MPRPRWGAIVPAVLLLAAAAVARQRLAGREAAVLAAESAELVQTVVATGRVAVRARVAVGSVVAATVAEVAAREGERVEGGATLVRLRDDEARAALGQARAALALAQAGEQQAQAGEEVAASRLAGLREATAPAAEQAVRVAAADLEAARLTHERVERLVAQGMLPRADLDEARRALETARGRHERERTLAEPTRPGGAEERAAVATLAQAQAAGRQARAAVAQAEAGVAAAVARLADLTLRAPAAGTVISRAVEAGDAIQPGRTLLELSLPGRTEIVAPVDEKNLALLAVGQRAVASADAYPARRFPAVLATLVPAVAAASGTVTARFDVPDPPAYLLPDMTVSVEVEVARRPGALSLPADAVRDLATGPWVLAVRDGRAVRVPVGIGVRGAGRLEVVSGLRAGDLVVPPAESRVAEGDRVRPRAAGGR